MRTRRSAEEARERILEAAEKKLVEGGPEAVRVQPLARELGLSDAAIHHHFGSRQGLLEALLRRAGRRLKLELEALGREAAAAGRAIDLADVADAMLGLYEGDGGARLALWLRLAGWRERGSGMLLPLAEALHAERLRRAGAAGRPAPALEDTQRLVAMLSSSLLAETWIGTAMRRAAGLPGDRATERAYRDWLVEAFERLL